MSYTPLVVVVGPNGNTGLPTVDALLEPGDFVSIIYFANPPLLHINSASRKSTPSRFIHQTRSPIPARQGVAIYALVSLHTSRRAHRTSQGWMEASRSLSTRAITP
jgi:hypothetical protein